MVTAGNKFKMSVQNKFIFLNFVALLKGDNSCDIFLVLYISTGTCSYFYTKYFQSVTKVDYFLYCSEITRHKLCNNHLA